MKFYRKLNLYEKTFSKAIKRNALALALARKEFAFAPKIFVKNKKTKIIHFVNENKRVGRSQFMVSLFNFWWFDVSVSYWVLGISKSNIGWLLTLLTWLCWCVVPSAVGGVFWISSCFCWWLGCDGEDETINGFALTFPLLWSLIATPLSPSLLWLSFCDCVTCCDTVTIASEDGDVVTCSKRYYSITLGYFSLDLFKETDIFSKNYSNNCDEN